MNTQPIVCPECEKGHLIATVYADDFQHNEKALHVDGLECYICERCGADPVFADQIRRNHRRIADAKRRVDGMLTGDGIRALRDRLGLTQQDAAALFGGGTNAFSKYERGDVIQSDSMDRLLKLMAARPALLDVLREVIAGSAMPPQRAYRVAEPGASDMKP
jgi:HTH-type transcriptional regulator/antitoxin MqsA